MRWILVLAVVMIASLLSATPALASQKTLACTVTMNLGKDAKNSDVRSGSIGVKNIFTDKWVGAIKEFSSYNISNRGTSDDPYTLDFSEKKSFIDAGLTAIQDLGLNDQGWLFKCPCGDDGADLKTDCDAALTIQNREGNANNHLKLLNLSVSIVNPTSGGGKFKQNGKYLYGDEFDVLGIKDSNVIFADGLKLSNATPSQLRDDPDLGTIKLGCVSVDAKSTLVLEAKDEGKAPKVQGRVRNKGSFTNVNGVISGGPENNNVALLNEGGTARIEGGNVKGNIVVKGGTLTLAGGTITGDITVSGGKLVLEGAATVTGKITVESGTAVFSSGTVNGEVSNSGGTLDISDSINVKGRVSTSAGSTNISGGTLANVATSGSGTTTRTGNAKITGNVSTSGGTTTITGGSVDGDVTNNGGGSTVVSGGSFKNPVDPRFLSNVEHLSISGTDSASVRYAYSKEKLAEGHDVAIDVKDAQDGLLILDMGFKSGQKDAGSAIEASMVSLVPGWKYTQRATTRCGLSSTAQLAPIRRTSVRAETPCGRATTTTKSSARSPDLALSSSPSTRKARQIA